MSSLFHIPIYIICKEKFLLCKHPYFIILHHVERIITMPCEKMLGSLDNHFIVGVIQLHIFFTELISHCNPNNSIYYFKTLFR